MIRNSFNIALTQYKKGALSRYFDDVQNNLFIEGNQKIEEFARQEIPC